MNIKTLTKFATPVVLGASASAAMAGTGGSEFSDVATLLEEWSQGVLGKILALGALIVGIAFGLVRQSVVAAVIGGVSDRPVLERSLLRNRNQTRRAGFFGCSGLTGFGNGADQPTPFPKPTLRTSRDKGEVTARSHTRRVFLKRTPIL